MAGTFRWIILCAAIAAAQQQEPNLLSFNLNNFSNIDDAILHSTNDALVNSSGIWLTGDRFSSLGRTLYTTPIHFCSQNAKISFTTSFTFVIQGKNRSRGEADGLAFTIAPNLQGTSPGSFGRWLGLYDLKTNNDVTNRIFAVEFDNAPPDYLEFRDPDDNHVGLNLNSIQSVKTSNLSDIGVDLKSSRNIGARIDYDSAARNIKVFVSMDTTLFAAGLGPPVLEYNLDLCSVISKDSSFVGFSAGSGTGNVDFHRILSWNFSTSTSSASGSNKKSSGSNNKTVITAAVSGVLGALIILLGLITWFYRHRSKQRNKGYLVLVPHEMSYNELMLATGNFSEDDLLGRGGFGRVYKGTLPDGSQVAVKRFSQDSHQGEREFLAEVKTIAGLSHRNLVKLRGWCKEKKEMILVYDLMPNGSVDQLLFSPSLTWNQRFHILKGLAAALVYLHEDWEYQVVHRDVKLSNIMLDADMNARLGDFGLAKIAAHSAKLQTTMNIIGTFGYIAPEIGQTYRFTPASDTFSFGVVALELVTGTKAISLDVARVKDSQSMNRLLDEIDTRMNDDFVEAEVLKVLQAGLACVDSDPFRRPTMRSVLHFLNDASSGSETSCTTASSLSISS